MASKHNYGATLTAAALLYCLGIAHTTFAQSYVGIDLYLIQSPSGDPVYFPNGSAEIAAGGQVVGYPVNLSAPGGGGLPGDGLLWTPPAGAVVDLTLLTGVPANATDGVQQVGGAGHALLWSGTAASVVGLHPEGFFSSQAYGVAVGQQVGSGQIKEGTRLITHALLWNGSADSVVDLHPAGAAGFDQSAAFGTDGLHQVGNGSGSGTGGHIHALLWSGTASSVLDLNPTNLGIVDSVAYGVSGNQQVGSGAGSDPSGNLHAILWNGTANSAVDLHPAAFPGFDVSTAYGTNGTHQVGYAGGSAFVWSGTAESAVDLDPLLPFASQGSAAYTIDAQGNIFGIAYGPDGIHAVEWSPVPEPAAWTLGTVGLAMMIAVGCLKRWGNHVNQRSACRLIPPAKLIAIDLAIG